MAGGKLVEPPLPRRRPPLVEFLAERYGGSMVLESEIGVGTTVMVRFTAERTTTAPREPAATAARAG